MTDSRIIDAAICAAVILVVPFMLIASALYRIAEALAAPEPKEKL